MTPTKRQKLEAAGWSVGSAAEFLDLSDAESMLVDMKLALASKVKELRQAKKLTQTQLARLIGSSQSRVAKLEAADSSVSLELLVRCAAALGATRAQIGKIVGAKSPTQQAAAS